MTLRTIFALFILAGSAKAQAQTETLPQTLPPVASGHAGPSESTDTDEPQFSFELRTITMAEDILRPFRPAATRTPEQLENSEPFADWEALDPGQEIAVRTVETRIENAAETVVTQWTENQMDEFIQAAQENRRSNILFAPKVTVFNQQTACIVDETKRVIMSADEPVRVSSEAIEGMRFYVRTSLLDDGRAQIDVKIRMCSLQNRHEVPTFDIDTLLRGPEQTCTTIAYSAMLTGDVLHTAVLPPAISHGPAKTEKRITLASRLVGQGKNTEPEPQQFVWLISVRRINPTPSEK
ncbi:MAG TPA: hypothetical protein PK992_20820 [Planctomycetaceae bacterium]|nr:hypothetical protein [Planctomycetaceae bacterium]HRA90548.1 hypothetical protein [Planctomycetaceae bacterium]